MARAAAKAVWITVFVIGVLIVLLMAAARYYDWNQWRWYVERQVSESTGRSLEIKGDMHVAISLAPRVRVERIRLGNAPWGSRDIMLQADAIEFRLSLWPLLFGRLVLPEIVATRPDLLLERGPGGEPNWQLARTDKKPGKPPEIRRFAIHDGVVRYLNPAAKTELRFYLNNVGSADGKPPLVVQGHGTFQGEQSAVEGRTGSLLSLRKGDQPYRLDVRGHVGASYFDIHGEIAEPIRFQGADLELKLKGPDLAKLHEIIGLPMPVTPPYDLQGRLEHEGKQWYVRQFHGRVGDSDLTGQFSVDLTGHNPYLQANLRSRYLDIDDLAGLIGAPPQTGPGETASRKQQQEAARKKQRGRLLPDRPYSPARLRSIDFDVELQGEQVKSQLPLDQFRMHAVLKGGQLKLEPLNFGVAGGNIVSTVWVDARNDPLNVRTDVTMRTVQLSRLFPRAKLPDLGEGRFGGQAKLSASGNSIASMAARADGNVGIAIAGGKISNLLLELAGLDVAEATKFFLGKDKQVPIRCGVADLAVSNGKMDVRSLVFDTTDTEFEGKGSIMLGPETLDLTIRAHPKDKSILSARAPLKISGHFTAPGVSVKGGRVVEKGAAALALGAAVAPLAAIIPLIETGPGQNADCRALITKTAEDTAKGPGAGGG